MCNLLSANGFRLCKTPLFWGTLLLAFGFGGYMAFNSWNEYRMYGFGAPPSLSGVLFLYPLLIVMVLALFIPLFFGAEYSDGVIRNKLVTGSARGVVYLANLFSAFFAAVLFNGAYILGCALVGTPLLGWLQIDDGLLLFVLLGTLLLTAAYCALLTLIVMNTRSKALAVVLCVLCVLLLFVASLLVISRLEAPEYIAEYSLSVNGELQPSETPNPRYLRGAARRFYEMLHDLLPVAQGYQYTQLSIAHPARACLFSALVTVCSAAAGLWAFRRRDLN